MKRLSREQVLRFHEKLTEQFGGIQGVRDEGILDSALNAPFQTFSGVDLYPTVPEKAAHLGYGLIKNHAFADGNKRIGTHVMLVFLQLNGIELSYDDNDLIQLILDIASGAADDNDLLEWLTKHRIGD